MTTAFLDRYGTTLRLLGIVFAGLHLPLLAVAATVHLAGLRDARTLVVAALLGTLAAAVLTLLAVWHATRPLRLVTAPAAAHCPPAAH